VLFSTSKPAIFFAKAVLKNTITDSAIIFMIRILFPHLINLRLEILFYYKSIGKYVKTPIYTYILAIGMFLKELVYGCIGKNTYELLVNNL